jgi:hypothetical protein
VRFFYISIFLLAGCAALTTSDSDLAAASKVWGDCIAAAVIRLDDGRSDPVSVATGIAPACVVQYQHWTDLMVGVAISQNGKEYARQTMKDQEIKAITSAILIRRSANSKKQ